jgi:outer membrane protein
VRLLARAVEAEHLQTAIERGKMYPTVSLGGTVIHTRAAGMESGTNGILFGTVRIPLSELWSGRYSVASGEYRGRMAEKKLAEARNLIGLQTQQAWDELWASWRGVEFSRMAVQQADVNLREVQDKYTSGLLPLSDLLEAQALRQESLNRQIDTRSEYWVKHSAFLHVVGKDTANR